LRIRFFPSLIPDPNFFHPGSWILIKEFKYFNPKKWFLSSRKYDPGCSSWIRIPDSDPDFLLIPDPGSRGQKGTGSRIRIRNTGWNYVSPPSYPASECVSPLEPKGRGATLACGWGGGGTQFERLDRKLVTLYTIWDYVVFILSYFHFGGWRVFCIILLSVPCSKFRCIPSITDHSLSPQTHFQHPVS
jgi:hypothetical protein